MILKRIGPGVGANLYGQFFWLATQFVSVPVLVHNWSPAGFGIWAMLMTLPLLLMSTDLGFGWATAGAMARTVAREDFEDTRVSLNTGFVVVAIQGALLFALALFWMWLGPEQIAVIGELDEQATRTLAESTPLVLIYVSISMFSGIANAVYRVNGQYATGTFVYETGRGLEQVFVIAAVGLANATIFQAALLMVILRCVFTAIAYCILFASTPWARLDIRRFRKDRFRELIGPAMGAMCIPLCLFSATQGITLVVGFLLSPATAGLFAVIRLLFRVLVQFVGTIARASMPAFAEAVALDKTSAQIRIGAIVMISTILVAGGGSVALVLIGPVIVHYWIGGALTAPLIVYLGFATHALFGGLWTGMSNLLVALNKQGEYGLLLLFVNILGVAASIPLVGIFDLYGAVMCLAIIDIASAAVVIRIWIRDEHLTPTILWAETRRLWVEVLTYVKSRGAKLS